MILALIGLEMNIGMTFEYNVDLSSWSRC